MWSSSDPTIATVGILSGDVTGVAPGIDTIIYTVGAGCTQFLPITVLLSAPITGPTMVCVGDSSQLSDAVTGGTWSSSNTTLATVDTLSGMVYGVSGPSVVTISYTLPSVCVATYTMTVNAFAPITGIDTICVGQTTALSDAVSPGLWTSSNSSTATVDPLTGLVTGITSGSVNIFYTIPTGCSAFVTVIVNPIPNPFGPIGPI